MNSYLYKARSLTDGREVIGALIQPSVGFAYIATIESMNNMYVDELNDGRVDNLKLTRVLEKSLSPIKSTNITVEQRIKNLRLSKGWTLEELGKKLDTSKGTVNNWEKGRNLPNKENLKKLAELGDMTVEQLLSG